MPDGELVTIPLPVPVFETVNGNPKVAETLFAAFIVTTHEPVPEHAPPQPVKAAPELATADNVTTVPVL